MKNFPHLIKSSYESKQKIAVGNKVGKIRKLTVIVEKKNKRKKTLENIQLLPYYKNKQTTNK